MKEELIPAIRQAIPAAEKTAAGTNMMPGQSNLEKEDYLMKTVKQTVLLLLIIGLAPLAAAFMTTAAGAAQNQPAAETIRKPMAAPGVIDRANDIMAREVVNEQGQHLGYSKDLIIGKDGCIVYLIMLRGSAFGVIGPLIPVPWSMVTLQSYDKPLLIQVDPQVIQDAPGFTLDMWPDFFSTAEQNKIREYYRKHLNQ